MTQPIKKPNIDILQLNLETDQEREDAAKCVFSFVELIPKVGTQNEYTGLCWTSNPSVILARKPMFTNSVCGWIASPGFAIQTHQAHPGGEGWVRTI